MKCSGIDLQVRIIVHFIDVGLKLIGRSWHFNIAIDIIQQFIDSFFM